MFLDTFCSGVTILTFSAVLKVLIQYVHMHKYSTTTLYITTYSF